MEQIFKYPRTRHLEGSRQQQGDEDLDCARLCELRGKHLVLEEKVDGANCGISFGRDQKMYLQSRGHFLNGGYGKWLYAKHTVFYDRLPHYFMEQARTASPLGGIFSKKQASFPHPSMI